MRAGEQLEQDLYFQMYQTIWKFHKKYINKICDNDTFWDGLVNDADMLIAEYNNHDIMIALVIAELAEFDRLHREMIGNADTRV